MRRKKSINKGKLTLIILVLIVLLGVIGYFINLGMVSLKKEDIIKEINSHYNDFVKTNKECKLYDKDDNEVGTVGKGVELSLDKENITSDTKYFKVTTFGEEYYIRYQDVDKIEKLSEVSDRYKNYIVFNENIITNDDTSFYDGDDNLVFTFNNSYDLPIIIKDDEKYGIEFNNKLLYVKKDNVKETKKNNNTDKKNSSGVAVLNYHAFYDETNAEEKAACTTEICHSKKQFKSQLDLIKEKKELKENEIYVSAQTKENIFELKEMLGSFAKNIKNGIIAKIINIPPY